MIDDSLVDHTRAAEAEQEEDRMLVLEERIARLEALAGHLERVLSDRHFVAQMAECTLRAAGAMRKVMGSCGSWAVSPVECFGEADTLLGAAMESLEAYSEAERGTTDAIARTKVKG